MQKQQYLSSALFLHSLGFVSRSAFCWLTFLFLSCLASLTFEKWSGWDSRQPKHRKPKKVTVMWCAAGLHIIKGYAFPFLALFSSSIQYFLNDNVFVKHVLVPQYHCLSPEHVEASLWADSISWDPNAHCVSFPYLCTSGKVFWAHKLGRNHSLVWQIFHSGQCWEPELRNIVHSTGNLFSHCFFLRDKEIINLLFAAHPKVFYKDQDPFQNWTCLLVPSSLRRFLLVDF